MKKFILSILMLSLAFGLCAQRVSELPAATSVKDNDLMLLVQDGVTKKIPYYIVKGIQVQPPDPLWISSSSDINNKNSGFVKIKGKLQFDPLPPLALKVGRILTMTTDGKIEYARRLSIEPPDILPGIQDHGLIPPHTVLVLNHIDSSVYSMPFDYYIDDDVYHAETASTVLTGQSLEIFDQSIVGVSTISSGSGMLFSNASQTVPFRFAGVPTKPNEIEIDSLRSASVLYPYYSVVVRDPISNRLLGTPFPVLKEAVLDALSYSDANCDLNMNSFNIYNPYSINLEGGMELLESEINNVSSLYSTSGIHLTNTSPGYPIRLTGAGDVFFQIDGLPDLTEPHIDNYTVMLRDMNDGKIYERTINELLASASGGIEHGPATDPFGYFFVDQLQLHSFLDFDSDSPPSTHSGRVYFDGDSLFLYANSKWQALNSVGLTAETDPLFNALAGELLQKADTSSLVASKPWIESQHYLKTGDNMGNMTATGNLKMELFNIDDVDSLAVTSRIFCDGTLEVTNNVVFENNLSVAADLNVNAVNTGALVMTDPAPWIDQFRKSPFYFNDCFGASSQYSAPFIFGAVASGTYTNPTACYSNHPGVVKFSSSSSNNSGAYLATQGFNLGGFAGGEVFEMVVYFSQFDSVTTRLGFVDALSSAESTDGAYFNINSSGIVNGKCASNGSRTSTLTNYTLNPATWYRFKIKVTSTSRVDFNIYSDNGTLLYTNYVSTNIPNTSARATGFGLITLKESTGTGGAKELLLVDYIGVGLGALTR